MRIIRWILCFLLGVHTYENMYCKFCGKHDNFWGLGPPGRLACNMLTRRLQYLPSDMPLPVNYKWVYTDE